MYLLSYSCLFCIKVYRVFISAHLGGACRFYPTCSCYAEQVFLHYHPIIAIKLSFKRIISCRFFGSFGLDEPPFVYEPINNSNIKN